MKEDYQKALKKLTLFFLSNPVPFNGQSYQKQKEPGTSDQSLFRLKNKFRKIPLLVIYYLTKFDDVIIICKPIHDINYSTCGEDGKKLQKLEHIEHEKSFLDEIRKIFIAFEGLLFGAKTKSLIKNSGHKL